MAEDGLDLASYMRIARRWWWILAVGVIAGAITGYLLTNDSPVPMYEASTKLLVQSGNRPGVPSAGDLRTSTELARNYSDLLKTRNILQGVVDGLELPFGPDALATKISVTTPRSLMVITVRDTSPERVTAIANATTLRFIEEIRTMQLTQIARFQASLGQFGLEQDSSIIAAQASTMTTLSIIEDALVPPFPYNTGSSARNGLIIGVFGGLMLAGLLIVVIENLDDRVRSPEEVKALTGVDALGSVLRQPSRNGSSSIILGDESSYNSLTESYKFLHTNLEFANLDRDECRTILVTSCSPEEGKTTTAANLATAAAKEGKSVVLVDADLRKPTLHKVFNVENRKGLTHLLAGTASLEEVVAQTPIEGLKIIPSGALPPDASVVLRSAKMKEVARTLAEVSDLVIFDSPPLLSVTDPLLLVGLVDNVLLVVDAERTRRGIVKRGAETLRHANAPLVGTVLNKVSTKAGGSYYYYYYYYHHYSSSSENGSQRQRSRTFKGSLSSARRTLERQWEGLKDGAAVKAQIGSLIRNLKSLRR